MSFYRTISIVTSNQPYTIIYTTPSINKYEYLMTEIAKENNLATNIRLGKDSVTCVFIDKVLNKIKLFILIYKTSRNYGYQLVYREGEYLSQEFGWIDSINPLVVYSIIDKVLSSDEVIGVYGAWYLTKGLIDKDIESTWFTKVISNPLNLETSDKNE